jgi:hypothetical protein
LLQLWILGWTTWRGWRSAALLHHDLLNRLHESLSQVVLDYFDARCAIKRLGRGVKHGQNEFLKVLVVF